MTSDDGYRLTYGGLDYLALNAHRRSTAIYSLGNQIGVGKESDIYITASPSNTLQVLKIHRLGRISFRSVKSKRDYLRHRTTGSWMYLSRLAAQKEFACMKVLWREGFSVPEPVAWSRHTVVMGFVDAFPLRMVESVPEPGRLYAELVEIVVELARRGLIHGDFNEFNILIKEEEKVDGEVELKPVVIDFPQMVSTNHANARMYFDRDVGCVKRYFERRFKYVSDEPGPFLEDAMKGVKGQGRLDVEVEASGFSRKMARELERYVEVAGGYLDGEDVEDGSDDESEDGEKEEHVDEREGEEGLGDDAEDVRGDSQTEEPDLSEQLHSLSLANALAVKPLSAADYGLMPFELLSHDSDIVTEKVRKKKKAAGWAI